MSESRSQRLRRIFLQLAELPDAEREAALERACDGDDPLRAEVLALWRAAEAAGAFLANPSASAVPSLLHEGARVAEHAGAQIGRYKLLEQIGEGGMGTIWMAEQREPVKRRVALKIIKLGMDTKQVIARFEAERQALALMDHPHIAKVFDAGTTETGRPYFVMEYIKGIPILEYCDQEKLDTRSRLELVANVCHAIQHAHQKGIIHRDIKPSNVLVTLHDGVPVPKVIDFGIAKATNSELTTRTLFTEHRQLVGTPAYMSPEQAEMSGLDIDTRSDIYSLGVLLYELLTGTTPFDTKELLESGYAEMLRAIREDEPHKPSTRVSTLGDTGTRTAQQRRVELKKLSLLLRGDLDWIVMRCLEKDRARRYETANGLAADIRRHLNDEPVTAGAPSAGYRMRKFVKRHRAQVLAASFGLAAVLMGIVGTSWGLVEKSRARSADLQRMLEDEQRTAADKARLARNAEAVAALLGQCEDALRANDAPKATVAFHAAQKRAAEGGAEKEGERLARLGADLALLAELDAIDQFRWTWAANNFGDPKIAAARTRDALRKFGADPEVVSIGEAAARVEGSTIRGRVVLAMDRLLFREHSESLRAVLRHVDPNSYRDSFRDAVLAHDAKKLEELARDPAALEQPAEFAVALGLFSMIPVERRREMLEVAAFRRPSDLGLLMALQALGEVHRKDTGMDRVRWLQAALAADPKNSAAYINLGVAFDDLEMWDKGFLCFRAAVAADPQNPRALGNLGTRLTDNGKTDEAIPYLEKALLLEPNASITHHNLGRTYIRRSEWDLAIASLRKAIELDATDSAAYGLLGDSLKNKGRFEEAIASYQKAVELDPEWKEARYYLAELLSSRGRVEESIPHFRKAVELAPGVAVYLCRLGDALALIGKVDEAIPLFRKGIGLDPKYDGYGSLGSALKATGRLDEAIVNFRKSLELRPELPQGWELLSQALVDAGRPNEALPCARKAVELAPAEAAAYTALGVALSAGGQVEEGLVAFRKSVELDPTIANSHHNLGASLVHRGRQAEAVASYRKAVELAPKKAQYHLDLALALQQVGEHAAAFASFQRSLELDPNLCASHYNLGIYAQEKESWDEAIAHYRKALEIEPGFAEAHCNMAMCLANVDQYAGSMQHMRRGHELGSKRRDWRYPSADWVRMSERLYALEQKLPALLAGKAQLASNEERLDCAIMCQLKKLDAAAAQLYADVFAADAREAKDPDVRQLFDAAVSAARAGAGSAEGSARLDEGGRARLRKQSLEWLRAALTQHTKRLEPGQLQDRSAVRDALRKWRTSPEIACVRDTEALAALPAEERDAFERLWAEVATLLSKAEA